MFMACRCAARAAAFLWQTTGQIRKVYVEREELCVRPVDERLITGKDERVVQEDTELPSEETAEDRAPEPILAASRRQLKVP